jgi:hypothetical protein
MSTWLLDFLIALSPLLVLVGFLLLGRYPGERTLERVRRAIGFLLRSRSSVSFLRPVTGDRSTAVRGGRLIADSLAGRAPPSLRIFQSI